MQQNKKKILCLDFGEKRIGLAVSDDLGLTAQGKGIIKRKNIKTDLSGISNIIESLKIEEIVIGIPRNMNGSIGPQANKVFAFIEKLKSITNLPIYQWDERLSSSAVEKVLIEGNVRRQKRKKVIDTMAAQYILQGYLDRQYLSGNSSSG